MPTLGSRRKASLSPLVYLVSTILLISTLIETSAAKRPIVYTDLRLDYNYFPIYRSWHTKEPFEEVEDRKCFNLTYVRDGQAVESTYHYYVNYNVDADNLTLDDLMLESIDWVYKHHLIQAGVHDYDYPEDLNKSSDVSLISPLRCERELDFLLRRVDEFKAITQENRQIPMHPNVVGLFDAISPVEAGAIRGNHFWMGDWHQCSRREIINPIQHPTYPNEDPIRFMSRYCIASIRSPRWMRTIKQRSAQLESLYFKYPEQKYDYQRFFRIQVGFCLPESCDSRIFFQRPLDVHKLATSRLTQPYSSYELFGLWCLPDETSELRKIGGSGWVLISVIAVWIAMVLAATTLDLLGVAPWNPDDSSNLMLWISACSMRRNFTRLTSKHKLAQSAQIKRQLERYNRSKLHSSNTLQIETGKSNDIPEDECNQVMKPEPQMKDLDFLDFFKVYAQIFIVAGHSMVLIWQTYEYTSDDSFWSNGYFFHSLTASAVFYVDWFFVMSGIIVSYMMFVSKRVYQNTPIQWLYIVFHRYWRLGPLYIMMTWFNKTIFKFIGQGPNWDYGTSNMTIRNICERQSWAYPIFLISNWHPLHEECVMSSWYLSNDMQFFIFTPPILIGLSKFPIATYIGSLSAIGSCIVARFHRFFTDPHAKHFDLIHIRADSYMRNSWDMHPTYLYPHYRFPSYLLGILTGHYIYMVLSGKWRSPLYDICGKQSLFGAWMRRLTLFLGLMITIPMTFCTLLFNYATPWMDRNAKVIAALAYGTHHTYAALGVCVVAMSLIFGQSSRIRRFLSLPIWTTLSRLNYMILLINAEIVYFLCQDDEWGIPFSLLGGCRIWLTALALCYIIALPLHLLLESPLAQLERHFIAPMVFEFPQTPSKPSLDRQPEKAQLMGDKHISNRNAS